MLTTSKTWYKRRPLLDKRARSCDTARSWNREIQGFRTTEKNHRPEHAQNVRIEEERGHGCCADATEILKKDSLSVDDPAKITDCYLIPVTMRQSRFLCPNFCTTSNTLSRDIYSVHYSKHHRHRLMFLFSELVGKEQMASVATC